MKIGYARVSTHEQNLDLQLNELKKAGCDRIFHDKISGVKSDRPELKKALELLAEGDTLVVWKLDRLARSLKHLIEIVNDLEDRQIGFTSLTESVDTTTNGGKLIFHIFGALAEFERGLIVERTKAGLKAARARGKLGGRPRKLINGKKDLLFKLYDEGEMSINEICETLSISRQSLYNYLNARKQTKQI